jgi:cation diffusion facilitator CzcD-associated flavoprotein CzcO
MFPLILPILDWSRSYSPQSEILEYLKNVAKKYNVYAHIRFETEVIRAAWIKECKKWRIDLRTASDGGYTEESAYYDIL